MTAASSWRLGAVLLQKEDDGWKPVSLTRCRLRKPGLAYTVHVKESLPVVHALKKWRQYLHRKSFCVVTDQLSLKRLLILQDPRHKLAIWVLEIQDFDSIVVHANELLLAVLDALSRDAVRKPCASGALKHYKECVWGKGHLKLDEKIIVRALKNESVIVLVSQYVV